MAEPQPQAPRTRNTVTVMSKLPWGLDIFLDQDSIDEQSGKPVRVPRPETRTHLAGANSSRVIGGYGLTTIDADFWDAWVKDHKDYAPLKSGAISVQANRERAAAAAMDAKDLKTRLEPLDADKPGEGLTRVSDKDMRKLDAA